MTRHVTDSDHSPWYWLGRLSMAVRIAPEHPKVAQETLQDFLRSPVPSPELKSMLQKGNPR